MSQSTDTSFLELGIAVNSEGHPKRFAEIDKSRDLEESDFFKIPTNKMDRHAVIIAQSGSGKSFFLGRLIEELMIKSKARCLILDPNGDFRKINKIDRSLWSNNSNKTLKNYDSKSGKGKFTLESMDEFAALWQIVLGDLTIRSNRVTTESNYQKLKIWWPLISLDFLTEGLNPKTRNEMFHCHVLARELFNQISEASNHNPEANIFDKVKDVFRSLQAVPLEERKKLVTKKSEKSGSGRLLKFPRRKNEDEETSNTASGLEQLLPKTILNDVLINSSRGVLRSYLQSFGLSKLNKSAILEEKASFVFETYSWDTVNQYFGLMEKYEAQGILATEPYTSKVPRRLEVIDLPSIIDNETRAIILNSVLTHEWEFARQKWEEAINKSYETDERVPTFIVVDEAHNFVPSEPRSRYEAIVREQFRTIAAEGRKYGLFLILVSQRVDKVDPLVLSECGNKAVMRLDASSVVKEVVKSFGLDDIHDDIINKITQFKIGRLLLVGNWVNEPTICLTASRRTVEGGRNLREKHWAKPYSKTVK